METNALPKWKETGHAPVTIPGVIYTKAEETKSSQQKWHIESPTLDILVYSERSS